jgi:hypothetical protein
MGPVAQLSAGETMFPPRVRFFGRPRRLDRTGPAGE